MHVFDGPTALHELRGQPIQKCRMGGGSSVQPEIARGVYQASPEMKLPDAVDHHPVPSGGWPGWRSIGPMRLDVPFHCVARSTQGRPEEVKDQG